MEYHSPPLLRVRGGRSQIIQARPPMIPHGERAGVEDVPLPLPTCNECGAPIYYEQRKWHHRDPGRSHDAVADEIDPDATCKNGHAWIEVNLRRDKHGHFRCRLCAQDRIRKARLAQKEKRT